MNARAFLLSLISFIFFSFSPPMSSAQTLINFDDISTSYISSGKVIEATLAPVTNGYQGLCWNNFGVVNVPLQTSLYATNGYTYGMVSPPNVAFNSGGTPAEIDLPGGSFNFLSVYLTGAWNSNLNIEVQGFNGANLLYDETVVASATNSTLFVFNYLDIDCLTFNSSGGQNAGFPLGQGEEFAMDNLSIEFVPEPSTVLLTALGALALYALLKRKRA